MYRIIVEIISINLKKKKKKKNCTLNNVQPRRISSSISITKINFFFSYSCLILLEKTTFIMFPFLNLPIEIRYFNTNRNYQLFIELESCRRWNCLIDHWPNQILFSQNRFNKFPRWIVFVHIFMFTADPFNPRNLRIKFGGLKRRWRYLYGVSVSNVKARLPAW